MHLKLLVRRLAGQPRTSPTTCGTHSDLLHLVFGKFDVIFDMLI